MRKLVLIAISLFILMFGIWAFSQELKEGEEPAEIKDGDIGGMFNDEKDKNKPAENLNGAMNHEIKPVDVGEGKIKVRGLVPGKYDGKWYASCAWELRIVSMEPKNAPVTSGVQSIDVKVDDQDWYTYSCKFLERKKGKDNSEEVITPAFNVDDEGPHVISFRGIDNVGNIERDNSIPIKVDCTAPWVEAEVKITGPAPYKKYVKNNILYVPKPHEVELRAFDTGVGEKDIYFAVNEDSFQLYKNPFPLPRSGWNVLRIVARDRLNNESSEKVYNVFVDDKAPTVIIKPKYALLQSEENKEILIAGINNEYDVKAFDKESGISEIIVEIDKKGVKDLYKKPVSFISSRKHDIDATAIDNVGNQATNNFVVHVDAVPPDSLLDGKRVPPIEDLISEDGKPKADDKTNNTSADANKSNTTDATKTDANKTEKTKKVEEEKKAEEDKSFKHGPDINN